MTGHALQAANTWRSSSNLQSVVTLPSPTGGPDSLGMQERLNRMRPAPNSFAASLLSARRGVPNEVSMFESRLQAKVLISNVSMHIKDAWRTSLFRQLDDILDYAEWDTKDALPTEESIRTFLRMIIFLRFKKCPGLGVSNGHLLATWDHLDARLTIECKASDSVRWLVSHLVEDIREVGSGITIVQRLARMLHPYETYKWVFDGGDQGR